MRSDDQCAALINQGLAALQAGNGERAWLLLQTARDSGCRQAELHVGFGALYEQLGEWSKAHAAFDYAIRMEPNLAQGYNNRGRILVMLDQLAEAMADFQRAVALQPENARAHYNIGGVLAQQGEFAAALASFQRAANLAYAPAAQAAQEMQSQLTQGASPKPNRPASSPPANELALTKAMLALATFAYATSGPDRRLTVTDGKRFLGLGSKQQVEQVGRWLVTLEELHEFEKAGYHGSPRGATLEIARTPPFLLRVVPQPAGIYELSIWQEQTVAGTKQQAFKKMREHVYQLEESALSQALQELLNNQVLQIRDGLLTL